MGTVTDLGSHRAARDIRFEEAAARHPACRWVAGEVFYIAHRRTDTAASCGAPGELILAPPGVPLCEACYPARGGD